MQQGSLSSHNPAQEILINSIEIHNTKSLGSTIVFCKPSIKYQNQFQNHMLA